MNFTGKNLQLVRSSLDLAIFELKNQIATCPDVNEYACDLDECEKEIALIQKLIDRIDADAARREREST